MVRLCPEKLFLQKRKVFYATAGQCQGHRTQPHSGREHPPGEGPACFRNRLARTETQAWMGQQGPSKPRPKHPPPASVCEKSCSLRAGSSLFVSTVLLLAQCPQQPSWLGRWAEGWLGPGPASHAHYSRHFLALPLMPALLLCRSSGALICRWAHGCPCTSQHPRLPAIATCLSTASREMSGGCESTLHVGGHFSLHFTSFHWLEARFGSQCGWWKSAWMVEVSMMVEVRHGWCSPQLWSNRKSLRPGSVAAPPVLNVPARRYRTENHVSSV